MDSSRELLGDTRAVAKYSEHGLGHLINPTDPGSDDRRWIKQGWDYVLALDLGIEPPLLPWLDLPALSKVSVSSPGLLAPFRELNGGLAYGDQIRPFNFLLSAHVAPLGHPTWCDPTHFHLIARFEADPAEWLALKWIDRYSGRAVPVTTESDALSDTARLKSYRSVLDAFRTHPEPKSAGRDGAPCGRNDRGLLRRRRIQAVGVEHTGKESHRYEEIEAGLVHDADEISVTYGSDEWETLKHRLHDFPARRLANVAGVDVRSIRFYRAGREPTSRAKQRLLDFFRRN